MPDAHKLVEATSGAEGQTRVSQPHDAPIVFLVGSPRALARFGSTWDAFGKFLRDSGMLGGGGKLR